eukprot:SAG31_NODE_523_length_14545_cov_4.805067_17_plen_410_part_00
MHFYERSARHAPQFAAPPPPQMRFYERASPREQKRFSELLSSPASPAPHMGAPRHLRICSIMGPAYALCWLIRKATVTLACAACLYSIFAREGPGDALLPCLAAQLAAAVRALSGRPEGEFARLVHTSLPSIGMGLVWIYWLAMARLPSEMLPSSFFDANSFMLFGRNFTIYKAVDDKEHESSVATAAEHIVMAAVMGVVFGGLAVGTPTALKSAGLLNSAWPPDAVPGYLYERLSDSPTAHNSASPRRAAAASRSVGMATAFASARTAGMFTEAIADELLYRSVLYRRVGVLFSLQLSDFSFRLSEEQVHGEVSFLPLVTVAALFGCKFLGHRGEYVFGVLLGLALQLEMGVWDCVTPTIVTHAIVLIVRDVLRAVRPLQKPTMRPGSTASELEMSAIPKLAADLHMT